MTFAPKYLGLVVKLQPAINEHTSTLSSVCTMCMCHSLPTGSVKFIVELEDLPHPPCPSLLASSLLIHFSPSTLPWQALVDTWLEEAKTEHNLNTTW